MTLWTLRTAYRCSGCRLLRAPPVGMRCLPLRQCPAAHPACARHHQRPQRCLIPTAALRRGPGACAKCCHPLLEPAGTMLCSLLILLSCIMGSSWPVALSKLYGSCAALVMSV